MCGKGSYLKDPFSYFSSIPGTIWLMSRALIELAKQKKGHPKDSRGIEACGMQSQDLYRAIPIKVSTLIR